MIWEFPEEEIVIYDSFLPISQLLENIELSAVQLYAIWTIFHLCSRNRKQYLITNLFLQPSYFNHSFI
jgi:hypothetical protein